MSCRHGRSWTSGDEAELSRLIEAGASSPTIAHQLGRSQMAIDARRMHLADRDGYVTQAVVASIAEAVEPLLNDTVPQSTVLTREEVALLQAATFDEHGWELPDASTESMLKLQRTHMIERRRGRWYLRPKAFQIRARSARVERRQTDAQALGADH